MMRAYNLLLLAYPASFRHEYGEELRGVFAQRRQSVGPIGAVAGAVVGYTAGPHISNSWGLRRRAAVRQNRRIARQDAQVPAGDAQPAPAQARTPARAAATSAAYSGPPAQGLD